MYCYTVRCEFTTGNDELAKRWLAWLLHSHIQEVLNSGATRAQILQMTAELPTYEIRYEFESEKAFKEYEANHAPRLRDAGIEKFPPDELGLNYSRTDGYVFFTS